MAKVSYYHINAGKKEAFAQNYNFLTEINSALCLLLAGTWHNDDKCPCMSLNYACDSARQDNEGK